MPLEEAAFISDLVATNPVHATDNVEQGDDHIRLIKAALLATFPNITGAVSVTHTVLNGVQNASNLTSGTLPDARLSSNVPLKDAGTNAFAGNATIGGTLGVTGNVTLTAALSVGGNLTLTGTLNSIAVTDFARLSQSNAFAENATFAKQVSVGGATLPSNVYGLTVMTAAAGTTQLEMGANDDDEMFIQAFDRTESGLRALQLSATNVDITGTVSSPNTSASEVGYKGVPQNIKTDDYTAGLADAGESIIYAGSGGHTFTIPAGGTIAFPAGTVLTFVNFGAGAITIAITDDTLYLAGAGFSATGSRTLAASGLATALKVSSTEWLINGAGLS